MNHNDLMSCRDYVLEAFTAEANHRKAHPEDWIERERLACTLAANEWAEAHGYPRRLTVVDVEQVENLAIGHVDYARKLALRVAEAILLATTVTEGVIGDNVMNHNDLMSCRDYVLQAFTAEANHRKAHPSDWIERERLVCTLAANEWAEAHGYPRRLTVVDVEQVENLAIGHVDYARKLALRVAEAILLATTVTEGVRR